MSQPLASRALLSYSTAQRRLLVAVLAVATLVAAVLVVLGPSLPRGAGASIMTETIFGSAQPQVGDSHDHTSVELGLRFRVAKQGTIAGVRFWKSAANTGTHTGSLWSSTGQRLSQVTFTHETASGWQQAMFASPVKVEVGNYVVSYHTTVGDYADDAGYFTGQKVGPSDVHTLSSRSSGSTSVYSYAAATTFPTLTWKASNYWVDVVYQTQVKSLTTASTTTVTSPPSTTATTAPPTTAPTTTSTTSTTQPPTTTTTTPSGGGWPCGLNAAAEACYAANTGASGSLKPVNGDVKLTSSSMTYLSSGAQIATPSGTDAAGRSVYSGYDINGCVQIATGMVALNNSSIHSADRCVRPANDGSGSGPALVTSGGTSSILAGGVSLTSDTLNGLNIDTGTAVARPCLVMGNMIATRLDVQGCTHDIWPIADSTLSYSYVHDPTYTYFADAGTYLHRNDIMVDGVSNITIDHVFAKQTYCPTSVPGSPVGWCNGATSAISMLSDWGGDHHVVVTNNYVMGGSNYDMYGGMPLGTDITIANNHFAPWGYTGVGVGTKVSTARGTSLAYGNCDGVVDSCSGNVDAESGTLLSF